MGKNKSLELEKVLDYWQKANTDNSLKLEILLEQMFNHGTLTERKCSVQLTSKFRLAPFNIENSTYFLTKQATLMRTSSVWRLSLLLVFPGLSNNFVFTIQRPANKGYISKFSLLYFMVHNKLECLYLASPSSPV